MFADNYLKRNQVEKIISKSPNPDVNIIVVIPCFYEPEVVETLNSLLNCSQQKSKVEVLIVINHSEIADSKTKLLNQKTKIEIEEWLRQQKSNAIKFSVIGPLELKKKWAGAGVARKIGMDEAALRFNTLFKPNGIIVSLDADTLVEENYLVEIEKFFQKNTKYVGATISFEHRKNDLPQKHLEGMILYEKYLKYYKKALTFTTYPFSMFTIGSAFAVTANAYVKRGGMNRRQAGEDFYFLQGLVQLGKVAEIKTTKVFPSARLSNRVPFGTGPTLQKWMTGDEDLTRTYNFNAFLDLKEWFGRKDELFQLTESGFIQLVQQLNPAIRDFILFDNFYEELADLNKNCSSLKSFQNRFYHKFNAFKILKFLNFAHEKYYTKADLNEQIKKLNDEY